MFTLKGWAVQCFISSNEIFVLRSRQICLRTNSYTDPNQHYNTNLNSHMHPSVHIRLGLVEFISFQNPQYYFCSCQPKEIQSIKETVISSLSPSWEKQMSKTDTVARFSLIFARKVHFSENSSVRENFCQN